MRGSVKITAFVSSGSVTGACGRYASRDHAVNDSVLPQREMMQMRYRVTRCVEAIYGEVSKRIRLKSLYNSTACGTVCCTTST